MAKKEKSKVSAKTLADMKIADTIVSKMIMSLDDNYVSTLNLNEKNAEFKSIINDELELARGVSKGSIIDFTKSLSTNNAKNIQTDSTDDDLYRFITQNSGPIYETFTQRYKNKFIEAQDLNFISKFVPSLSQAIRIALNHITSSDDLSGAFTRSLDFGENLEADDASILTRAIEQFETDNKLLFKLKNTCYYNCLVTGKYYVYAVSYSKLFTEYSKSKALTSDFEKATADAKGNSAITIASEGVTYTGYDGELKTLTASCALEAAELEEIKQLTATNVGVSDSNADNMRIRNSFVKNIADVVTLESAIRSEVLEGMAGLESILDNKDIKSADGFRKIVDDASKIKKNPNMIPDGTAETGNKKGEKFDITGTYIKFIDATKVIPIKVLDEVIGYLYVETKAKKKDQDAARFMAGELTNVKREDAIEKIARMLAQKIATNFSAKFVADNIQFKNLIANCILANGVVNTEYKIQFISTDDMIPFNVNPDENGDGQSCLKNSMFPAKLLTAYTMKKNLNYINKSGDKSIAHVRGGQVDVSRKNQVMKIIRNLQESNVTFGDMMSDYSMMFHKYASDNNIVMPTGRNGNRLVEFEKMEGQNIDMSTDYEKTLENQAITATGIPPLIIEQYNQADFSKAYTTAHLGFAGSVAGWQSDLEESTTILYKKIIENLDVEDAIKQRVLPLFKFKLPRPKTLSALNNTESLSNAMQIADNYTQLKYGEIDQNDDRMKEVVNQVKLDIVKDQTPFIDWEKFDDIAKEAELRVDNVKSSTGGDSDSAGASEF